MINKPTPRPTPTTPTLQPTTGPNRPLLHNHRPPPPIFVSQLPPHQSQPLSKPRSKLWKVVERGGNKEGRAKKRIGEGETPIWDRETHRERKTSIWATEREQSTDLSEELEAFGFGFEQNQEIKRIGQSEKEKKSTTTSCGDEQGGRARSFWPWTCFGREGSLFFGRERGSFEFWKREEAWRMF